MIIAISGSVGSGKTSVSKRLAEKLGAKLICLNERAIDFKIKQVPEIQTFDFDIDKLVAKVNREISEISKSEVVILEGHFAHFLNPDLVDFLFVISRDLKDLKKEYEKRGYNKKKQEDNLEVESFNLCFYEGIEEGYRQEEQIFLIENNSDLESVVEKIEKIVTSKEE